MLLHSYGIQRNVYSPAKTAALLEYRVLGLKSSGEGHNLTGGA
jgi:hypothetical protein